MKINRPNSARLPNDRYVQLIKETIALIQEFGAEKLGIAKYFDGVFMVSFASLNDAFKKVIKSSFTQLIQDADASRDDVYYGICDIVRANLRNRRPEVKAAATRLKILLDRYGNIARKTLDGQTSSTVDLLIELNGKHKDDVSLLKMDEWVSDMKQTNDEFSNLMRARFKETANRSDVTMAQMRKTLDNSLRNMCKMLETFALLEPSETNSRFIRKLNIIYARYGGAGNTSTGSTPSTGSGTGCDFDCIIIPPPSDNDIPLWSAGEHYTQMKIGDRRRTADGRIWEVIDLGQAHRDPAGEFGHFGWKLVG